MKLTQSESEMQTETETQTESEIKLKLHSSGVNIWPNKQHYGVEENNLHFCLKRKYPGLKEKG